MGSYQYKSSSYDKIKGSSLSKSYICDKIKESAQSMSSSHYKSKMSTRHNSADSVPTSNFVCITEVAIKTTFRNIFNIAGIIMCTCR